jgi:hypothetical protein
MGTELSPIPTSRSAHKQCGQKPLRNANNWGLKPSRWHDEEAVRWCAAMMRAPSQLLVSTDEEDTIDEGMVKDFIEHDSNKESVIRQLKIDHGHGSKAPP